MAEKMTTELKFLLQRERVPDDIQRIMGEAGVHIVKQFAVLVKDADEMRELAKGSFQLGECKDLAGKVKLSCLICAFNAAKARSEETDNMDAEAEVRALPKVIPGKDYLAMRPAFKEEYWELTDDLAPG